MIKLVKFLLVASIALYFAGVEAENPSNLRQFDQELDPLLANRIAEELAANPEATVDREKRLILLKKIGLKAGLLDLVFGKIDSFLDSKTRYINEFDKQNIIKNQKYFGISPPQPKYYYYQGNNNLKTTTSTTSTPSPIQFELNAPVSFVIPDRLYGSSFTLVTNASRIISDVIYNTASRAQELADVVNTKLKTKFGFAKKLIKIGDDPEH